MGQVLAALAVTAAGVVTLGATGPNLLGTAVAQELPRPTFAARADLVVLHVMVKDRRGVFVTGLRADAFTVLEDGRPQTIRFFGMQDAPVTVGLIIDGSGSMVAVRERVIAAAVAFAETSNSADDIFALTFNERVAPVLPARAPFTGDPQMLRAALSGTFVPRGRTALYDAIGAGLDYVAKGRHETRVLVVVSDGGDNASRATFDEVLAAAQIANTVIYTIAFVDPLERDANPKRLEQLARTSGGESFQPGHTREIDNVLRHIARDIRNTYTIGYGPSDTTRRSRIRRIQVRVHVPDGRGVRVRARAGYVLGDP